MKKDKEILEKAIQIAVKNGWENKWKDRDVETLHVPSVIFNKEFAKYLFGTADKYGHYIATGTNGSCGYCGCPSYVSGIVECWEYFLIKMALEKDYLEYLWNQIKRQSDVT
jgi:hypothetical protein